MISLVYGMAAYVFFLCTFVYAIGFVGGIFVPKTVDGGASVPLIEALAVNFLALGIFADVFQNHLHRLLDRWIAAKGQPLQLALAGHNQVVVLVQVELERRSPVAVRMSIAVDIH